MLTIAGVLAYAQASAAAEAPKTTPKGPLLGGQKILGGVELGGVAPLNPMKRFTKNGASLSPYLAYKYNRLLGVMGNLHIVAFPNKDRPGVLDDDVTWIAGATAGPRIDIPISDVEIYGTAQMGIFTGLSPNGAVTDTSWGASLGGGASLPVFYPGFRLGLFAKYTYLDQRAHGRGQVTYALGGLNLEFNFSETPPPAPPPKPTPTPATAAAAPATGKKIVLRGVNFDFDKSNIRADARPILDEATNTLKAEGGIAIISEGHTDSRGTDEYNQQLSLRRAAAVRDYLVKGGIAADRIRVEGYGESKPVASNDTDDGRAQNRRVELRVADK
jgi:outer membrane protein OmpA-like peptidoglycan-associated protein